MPLLKNMPQNAPKCTSAHQKFLVEHANVRRVGDYVGTQMNFAFTAPWLYDRHQEPKERIRLLASLNAI